MQCLPQLLKHTRLVVMDIDGVLTDGKLFYSESGFKFRSFDVKDGMGIKLLQGQGLEIAWISGGSKGIAEQRAADLNVKYVFTQVNDKSSVLRSLQNKLNFNSTQTIYLGDDINDLVVLPHVNCFLVPVDAHPACLQNAHWIGRCKGGNGFVREVADQIISNLGVDPYLPFASHN